MNKKFTLNTAVYFQGMEQRTAHLQGSLSLNLFNKLKGISFVIVLGVSTNLYSQDDNAIWDAGLGIAVPDADFKKFPPFTILPSSQPTYRIGFGLPPTANAIPLYVEGNIGTNHSFAGTFGTVGGSARWNALGDRIPLGFLPYISTTGLRSTWENWGMNVGMGQTYSGTARDALISWQDATAPSPTLAQNRLVFGVRDSSTTNFQELGQFRSNGTFGIGFNDLVVSSTFTFDQKLELYDFSSNTLFQRWRTITSSPTGGARIGIDNTNQFQIRNEESANIEFWTDGALAANPRMTIDNAGVVRIGAAFTSLNRNISATGGIAPGTPSTNVLFTVNGSAEIDGDVTSAGDLYITSDERLKTNFSSLNNDWRNILKLNPYSYDFRQIEGLNLSSRRSFGFKAQEVKEVFPSLVAEGDSFLSVNYIGFIPFLTQGLQEHEERLNNIENLRRNIMEAEQKIMELEREIEVLQNQNTQFAQRFGELEEENKDLKSRLAALEEFVYKQQSNGEGFGQTGSLNNPASLEQNEPNPFAQETIIRYFLPEGSANAKIEVKNAEGKIVGSFNLTHTGKGSITLSAGALAAGTFFYSLVINNNIVDTKKMVLMN